MVTFDRRKILLLAPVLALLALGLRHQSSFAAIAASAQPELIDQPSEWVPFSADLQRIHEVNGSVFYGRNYRSSDGSTRNETGRSGGPINSIAIKNIAQSTFYYWTPKEGWTSQNMTLPPWGWRPDATIFNEKMKREPESLEGFELISFVSVGRTFYRAPKLNLFTLVMLVPCKFDAKAKCGTWHSNIKVGVQKESLFLPPNDVAIVPLPEPGGIVTKPGTGGGQN